MTSAYRRPELAKAASGFLLALLCAGVAACGPAGSQGAAASEVLDTSQLPRVAGAKQIYASPFSTVYTTPASVAQAADSIAKTMTSAGWKAYVAPFTAYAAGPEFQMMSFKKGPQAVEVSISRAPAQGNATSVSYTGLALVNDLPAPNDAIDIAFDPTRPYLSCFTAMMVPATLDYYTNALAPMGYVLWPGLAQQTANKKASGAEIRADHAYFVRDGAKPLHLVMHRGDEPRTKVEIEAVSAEMLTAEVAPDVLPEAPSEQRYHTKKAPDGMDKMFDDAMQQMTNAILTAAGEAVANTGKPSSKPVSAQDTKPPALPEMFAEMAEAAGVEQPAAETSEPANEELVAEDMDGFPVPESRTSTHSGKTKYRLEREVTVPASLASVLAFYRRELPKVGIKESGAIVEGDMTLLKLTTPTGKGVLSLKQVDGETVVSFIERREDEAKKAGILPKSGQAKLIFGSMAETPATITLGKQTIKLDPGAGSGSKPDGPMLDLAPGKYAYTVAVPGAPASNEEVEVAEGEAWALVVGPGGGSMPLHMY